MNDTDITSDIELYLYPHPKILKQQRRKTTNMFLFAFFCLWYDPARKHHRPISWWWGLHGVSIYGVDPGALSHYPRVEEESAQL
jgi:hypothetical protein